MKTVYNLFITASLFFGVSCSGLLDVEPDGQISQEDIFLEETTIEQYINSCYDQFPIYAQTYGWTSNHPIAISDEAYETNSHGSNAPIKLYGGLKSTRLADNALIKSSHNKDYTFGMLSSWDLFFRNIRRCNLFLANIEMAPGMDDSAPGLRESYEGEIRVLRAYYYLELFTSFGEVPIFTEPLPEDFDNSTLVKNSAQDVVEFIVNECQNVIDNNNELSWRRSSESERLRMSKGIASAIKSRAALFYASPLISPNGDNWVYAETETKKALNELLDNGYSMTTNKSGDAKSIYQSYYTSTYRAGVTPSDSETIMISSVTTMGWGSRGHNAPCLAPAYRAGLCPTQQLVDAYPMANGKDILDIENPYKKVMKSGFVFLEPNYAEGSGYNKDNPYANRDPRFEATIAYNGKSGRKENGSAVTIAIYNGGGSEIRYGDLKHTHTGYYSNKWRHPAFTPSGPNPSWRIFSLGEVYLNYAEAALEAGYIAEAIDATKPTRTRDGMPSIVTGIKGEVRRSIHNERRIEFAYTGLRDFDLRRWGTSDEAMTDEIRYPMAMWIEKVGQVFEYTRVPVGVQYDRMNNRYSGIQLEKLCNDAKYRLHPLALEEVNRILKSTGVNWQNRGWN